MKKKEEGDAREEEERRPRGGGRGEGRAQKKRERETRKNKKKRHRASRRLSSCTPPREAFRAPHTLLKEQRRERKKERKKKSVCRLFGTKLKKIIGQKFQTSTLTQKKERGEREEPSSSSLEVRVALRVRTPRRAKDGERRREENVVVVFPVEETVR